MPFFHLSKSVPNAVLTLYTIQLPINVKIKRIVYFFHFNSELASHFSCVVYAGHFTADPGATEPILDYHHLRLLTAVGRFLYNPVSSLDIIVNDGKLTWAVYQTVGAAHVCNITIWYEVE